MIKILLKLPFICLIFMACNYSTKVQEDKLFISKDESIDTDNLWATLILNDSIVSSESDLKVFACIQNKNTQSIRLEPVYILENPVLSLQVYNEKGDEMHTDPPVTPYNDSDVPPPKILDPDEKYNIVYNSLNMFSPALPKGKYCIKMKFIQSKGVCFQIK